MTRQGALPLHNIDRGGSADTSLRAGGWVPFLAAWLLAVAYILQHLHYGWVPHDEGTLAHSAERVLAGELPHRDFGEVYTGGLSYLHALALRWFGFDLRAIRWLFFGFVVAWLPAVYYVASRFVRPLFAALLLLFVVAWSIPNYPAAMPSWYNLIFTTFGVAAFMRYVDTRRVGWVVAAGVAAGLSLLVKVVAIYFIAGGVPFLTYLEQERSPASAGAVHAQGDGRIPARVFSLLLSAVALGPAVALLWLVTRLPSPASVYHFAIPATALGAFLIVREWTAAAGPLPLRRATALLRSVGPFVGAAVLPFTVFIVIYVFSDGVGELLRGVFVKPASRLEHARFAASPLALAWPALLLVGILVVEERLEPPRRRAVALVGAIVAAMLLLRGDDLPLYRLTWLSLRPLVPLIVTLGVIILHVQRGEWDPARQARVFLLLATVAMFSLVQFPFAAPVYFVYVMPLVALAGTALLSPVERRPTLGVLMAFYLLFALRWVNTGFIYHMGVRYVPSEQTARLALDRGGLYVAPVEKEEYERLVALLREHQRGGYTFVTPDAPEAYFLSGLRNPSGTLFDFLEDGPGRVERVMRSLERHDVRVVAINTTPGHTVRRGRLDGMPFSRVDQALVARLVDRYPSVAKAGSFIVRWRP